MKKILYATDFSGASVPALKYALELSKRANASLIALHIFDVPTIFTSPVKANTLQDIDDYALDKNLSRLRDFLSDHLPEGTLKNIHLEVREVKSPVDGITVIAKENKADLIVMGTKGESRLREMLIGRVTKGVIQKAGCPVLMVPEGAVFNEPKRIVYATDFDEQDVESIAQLSEIARLFKATITVLHISIAGEYGGKDKMEWLKELLRERVKYSRIKFESILTDYIYPKLNNYVVANQIAWIVMLEHENKSMIDKWVNGDLVQRMEIHTSIPLLSFNEQSLSAVSVVKQANAVYTE